MIKKLQNAVARMIAGVETHTRLAQRARYEDLRDRKQREQPRTLSASGYKIFSQSDEDGMIAEIFRRIGTTNKRFVEFGVGDGLENNTLALLYQGWTGLWIDGSDEFCRTITAAYDKAIASGQLALINSFITRDNIDVLITSRIEAGEIDLLSVDIDGNDAHVYRAIKSISPRVIVFEYNAKFGPEIDYCMAYDAVHMWRKSDRFGASLKHYETLLDGKGYRLVGCNLVGTNAFFVRDDLIGDKFDGPFTAAEHFEPARYELAGIPSGHPPIHATFATRVGG
ncbi:MAG: hypothetical protein JHD35_01245 [Sphingopyxis sp.]|nr:hypothetical protein [Sphingopyxis sp.]